MSGKLLGQEKIKSSALAHIQKLGIPKLAAALYEEAENIMGDSKENYVPVDLGTLRSSGTVEQPEINGNSINVLLGFGGASAPYALRQHEDMSLKHDVGGAKYLERPLLKAVPGMAQRIAARHGNA